MDINKFLEQTGGQWFSQRTTYNLTQTETEVENSKANLTVEILAPDHPQIIDLCQVNSLNSRLMLGALATSWDTSPDWGKPKQQGSSLLALIKNEDNEKTGQIYRVIKKPKPKIIVGTYILGNDQALTFTLKQNNNSVEERIWFGSPNLRMRTIVNKNQDQCTMTSFYSEIRKVTQK